MSDPRGEIIMTSDLRKEKDTLDTFLIGLYDPSSSLRVLRGQQDVLRIIWIFVCEEWWHEHIHRFIPKLYRYRGMNMRSVTGVPLRPHQVRAEDYIPDLTTVRTRLIQEWKEPTDADFVFSGCPMAVIARDIVFPGSSSLNKNEFAHQQDNKLCINMMPFDLSKPNETLPAWCHGYIPMIEVCASYMKNLLYVGTHFPVPSQTAFLTIDERVVHKGETHRRKGLHVEAPIWTSSSGVAPASLYWGGGPIRASRIQGGIFCASNVSNTTALWNCQVHDPDAHVIRRHGSLEHCRRLLGKPSKILQAGEMIWMTDRTPHESLPMPYTGERQFFRLVVGKVSAWFTEHNTPNPLGYQPNTHDPSIQIIQTNKYVLCRELIPRTRWEVGAPDQFLRMREWKQFCHTLHWFELGHMIEQFYAKGIRSVQEFLRASDGLDLWSREEKEDDEALYQRISEMDMVEYMLQELIKVQNVRKFYEVLSPESIGTMQCLELTRNNRYESKTIINAAFNPQKYNMYNHIYSVVIYHLVDTETFLKRWLWSKIRKVSFKKTIVYFSFFVSCLVVYIFYDKLA
jgi:hypothetical protein